MDVPDNLLCVFSARVEEQRDSYVIEIPKREVSTGDVRPGTVYRTALLATGESTGSGDRTPVERTTEETPDASRDRTGAGSDRTGAGSSRGGAERGRAGTGRGSTGTAPEPAGPPVDEGEVREVEIESIGDQGDGIARVERGFVVIVPETEEGDRVTVEVTNVRENVAFAEVVDDAGRTQ